MTCPTCENTRFFAHQVCHHDVIVDAEGNFEDDTGIYYSGKPFGPFTCVKCGRELEEVFGDERVQS